MERKLGEIETPYGRAIVMQGHYVKRDGPIAVWVDDMEDGGRLATVSVNLVHNPPPAGHFWAAVYKLSPGLVGALRTCPLFEATGETHRLPPWGELVELWRIR